MADISEIPTYGRRRGRAGENIGSHIHDKLQQSFLLDAVLGKVREYVPIHLANINSQTMLQMLLGQLLLKEPQ